MRRVEAIARWYKSNVSPSRVNGHSSRCTMKMPTLYTPTARPPSSTRNPPMTRMNRNPVRIAMRISGTNSDDSRIASPLRSR